MSCTGLALANDGLTVVSAKRMLHAVGGKFDIRATGHSHEKLDYIGGDGKSGGDSPVRRNNPARD